MVRYSKSKAQNQSPVSAAASGLTYTHQCQVIFAILSDQRNRDRAQKMHYDLDSIVQRLVRADDCL